MAEHFYYSIASGSTGNCGLYVSGGTAILIDIGVSLRRLTAALKTFGMTPGELDALVITHEHIDHVKGLAMFAKKTEVPVFASCGTVSALCAKEAAFEERLTAFESGEAFSVGDVRVRSFATPHDAADSVGYILESDGYRFGFATDLGFVPQDAGRAFAKCTRAVAVPPALALDRVLETPGARAAYRLAAAVHHEGPRAASGHYKALVRNGSDAWDLCDDSQVTHAARYPSPSSTAYILFYELSSESLP